MRTATLLACLPLLGTGCFSLERPTADKRRFLLETARPTSEPAAAAGTLVVRGFHAQPPFAGPGFVTRLPGGAVETDFYHEWFAPLGAQLGEATRRWLGSSGLFAAVIHDGSQVLPTHLLEGDLLELSIDRSATPAQAVLQLEVVVLGSTRDIVLHTKLLRREALREAAPEAAVAAWQTCLAGALHDLEAQLRTKLMR